MSLKEIKEAQEKIASTFEEFKKDNDARLKEIESGKSSGAYDDEKLDAMEQKFATLEDLIDGLKASMERNGTGDGSETPEAIAKKASAEMSDFLKKGKVTQEGFNALVADYKANGYEREAAELEQKGLSVASDPNGGYFVRPEMNSNVLKKMFETSPMRQIADVQTIGSDAWESLYDYDEPDAGWVGEKQSRPETDSNDINMIRIPVHELYAQPKMTQKLADDAFFNAEQWHQQKVVEKFSRKENTAFISGNGVLQPKGILSYESGDAFNKLERQVTDTSAGFDADDLLDLQGKLFEDFQANASWLMRRQTATVIRKLKDSDNRYLFSIDPEAGLNAGNPMQLLGKQLRYASDMQAVGANSLPIAYGDFREGYLIVDRIGIRVVRDIYTSKPHILLYTTKRVGGGVKNFQAIKLLQCAS